MLEEEKIDYTRCIVCGRVLKKPETKQIGMGKICYDKYKKSLKKARLF